MSIKPHLDLATARRVLAEVVNERPDYVYVNPTVCLYWHPSEDGPGEPGCGIGVMLHRWQPEIFTGEWLRCNEQRAASELINRAEQEGSITVERRGIPATREDVPVYSTRVAQYLDRFQSRQDTQAPWGNALEAAESLAQSWESEPV